MEKKEINEGLNNLLIYSEKNRQAHNNFFTKKDLLVQENSEKTNACNSKERYLEEWTNSKIIDGKDIVKKSNYKLSESINLINQNIEENKNIYENVRKNLSGNIFNIDSEKEVFDSLDKKLDEIRYENEKISDDRIIINNSSKRNGVLSIIFLVIISVLLYFFFKVDWYEILFYVPDNLDEAIYLASIYKYLFFYSTITYFINIVYICFAVNVVKRYQKVKLKKEPFFKIIFLIIIDILLIYFLNVYNGWNKLLYIMSYSQYLAFNEFIGILYYIVLLFNTIYIRKYIERNKKQLKNNKKVSFAIMIILDVVFLIFNYINYKGYITVTSQTSKLIYNLFREGFIIYNCLCIIKPGKLSNTANELLETQIKKYNAVYYEIREILKSKLNEVIKNINNEYQIKLNKLQEEYERQLYENEEYYERGIKLPNEIISMYESLEKEEQDLFVMLARNAESEKEFSNIYVQCINAKNSRKVYDEQRKQTEEIKKQTRFVEEEHKKQTRILKERAEQERIHMETVERQNKELLRKQDEANKIAEKNAKKQLELARKSANSLENIEYEERKANDKSSDYYRGNR